MDIRKQVGLNIKRLRQEKGWSQEKLAFETELHRTDISGLERGVRNPTIVVLAKIAKVFAVPTRELLS